MENKKVRKNFNPHSREGSDLVLLHRPCPYKYFNPHSREGSDAASSFLFVKFIDFNPHSREGSDCNKSILLSILSTLISIHTPAKGVTYFPTTGKFYLIRYFNPHSREGSDESTFCNRWRGSNFNPHSREGSDTGCDIDMHGFTLSQFQSTLPRREWPTFGAIILKNWDCISIHTPAKGVTANFESLQDFFKNYTYIFTNFYLIFIKYMR